MNVEIGTKAVEFPEKEYINGIFVAVQLFSISVCHFTAQSAIAPITE